MHITNQQDLQAIVDQIYGCRALAIDTEFMREKTYYPLLCLVQMATDDVEFLIDPLSVKDLRPLAKVLTDPRTVKVFHAGRQDRELLYQRCGVAASPVFDTQAAAPLLGLPQQVGYGSAVSEFCGVKLKKADSLTDWTLRPLSASQIQYSLEDVRYLLPMYDVIREKLEGVGRLHWLDSEFAKMADSKTFENAESELWRKVKKVNSLPRHQLVHASNLAIWRERIAKKRNIPRKWILSDEILIEICKREPMTTDDLYKIRGTHEKLTSTMAKDIVHLIKSGKNSDPSTWPEKGKKHHGALGADAVADVMMGIVRLRAKENKVAPQVLATHDDLMELANGQRRDMDLLESWRYEIVGRELVDFLDGKESVSYSGGHLVVEPSAGQSSEESKVE